MSVGPLLVRPSPSSRAEAGAPDDSAPGSAGTMPGGRRHGESGGSVACGVEKLNNRGEGVLRWKRAPGVPERAGAGPRSSTLMTGRQPRPLTEG